MKLSVTRAWTLGLWVEAAPGSWPYKCEMFDFFFHFFFGLHQGMGLIMKHWVTRAWILWLWVEAAPVSWPCKCEKFDFLFHVFWLASRLGLNYEALSNESLNFFNFFWLPSRLGLDDEALGNESLNFVAMSWSCTKQLALWMKMFDFFLHFFIGRHQHLDLIMKHSVTGAWILWLWVEAARVNWPCKCEKLDFLYHAFWLASRLGPDYEALSKESLNFFIFFLACIKAWAWLWSSG
jgi:hypothetical protein